MQRLILPLALAAVTALLALLGWRHAHHVLASSTEPTGTTLAVAGRPLAAPPTGRIGTSGKLPRPTEARPPLGSKPTPGEIRQLVLQQAVDFNRAGGLTLHLSQTGQKLPSAFFEVRDFRFPSPCVAHDLPNEHPHWACDFELELRAPPYQPDFTWEKRSINYARLPDGGIDTLQAVVRVERGEPRVPHVPG